MSRVLVIANETVTADELLTELRRLEDERTSEYRVVVPARPLHEVHGATWIQDGAQEAARQRLDETLAILRAEGLEATGSIGDMRPIDAISDALMDFDADLIVISTHPRGRSGWLRQDLIDKTRNKFGREVHHIVSAVPSAATP